MGVQMGDQLANMPMGFQISQACATVLALVHTIVEFEQLLELTM